MRIRKTGMTLFPLFKQFLQLKPIIQPHDKLVLAVSGGIDSVVLLDLFFRLKNELKLRLIIAHLNHNVRGKSSLQDARFVQKIVLERGLTYEVKTLKNNTFYKKNN